MQQQQQQQQPAPLPTCPMSSGSIYASPAPPPPVIIASPVTSIHLEQQHEQLLQWMWADAGARLGSLFKALAAANPLRWSAKLTPQALIDELSAVDPLQLRPVKLRLCDQPHELKFESPESALQWLKDAQQDINGHTHAESCGVLDLHRVPFLVPAVLAFYLRVHSKAAWLQKNIFAAAAYSRRITQRPRRIVEMQADLSCCPHHRMHLSWDEFQSSSERQLFTFICEASKPFEQRGIGSQVEGWSIYQASRLTPHTSHLTPHTLLCLTPHTLRTIRHTSYITRYFSHARHPYSFLCALDQRGKLSLLDGVEERQRCSCCCISRGQRRY